MGKIWKEIGQILQKLLELPLKTEKGAFNAKESIFDAFFMIGTQCKLHCITVPPVLYFFRAASVVYQLFMCLVDRTTHFINGGDGYRCFAKCLSAERICTLSELLIILGNTMTTDFNR